MRWSCLLLLSQTTSASEGGEAASLLQTPDGRGLLQEEQDVRVLLQEEKDVICKDREQWCKDQVPFVKAYCNDPWMSDLCCGTCQAAGYPVNKICKDDPRRARDCEQSAKHYPG